MEELNPGKIKQKSMPPGIENNEPEEKIFKVHHKATKIINWL